MLIMWWMIVRGSTRGPCKHDNHFCWSLTKIKFNTDQVSLVVTVLWIIYIQAYMPYETSYIAHETNPIATWDFLDLTWPDLGKLKTRNNVWIADFCTVILFMRASQMHGSSDFFDNDFWWWFLMMLYSCRFPGLHVDIIILPWSQNQVCPSLHPLSIFFGNPIILHILFVLFFIFFLFPFYLFFVLF